VLPFCSSARAVDSIGGDADDECEKIAGEASVWGIVRLFVTFSFRPSGADMGIHDREYYRGETRASAWLGGVSPVCNALIAVNAVVFIAQQVSFGGPDFVNDWLAASPEHTLRHFRIWQFLTATFLHGDLLHLLGNMCFLYFIGKEMESFYGGRDFLAFYLSAAIFSTLAWVLIDALWPRSHWMMGASGAVMGVVTLYTLFYPKREILLFGIVPLQMWLLWAIFMVFPLVPYLSGENGTRIAVTSHLAGAGFALAYKQFDLRLSRLAAGRLLKPRLRVSSPRREPSRSRAPSSSWTSSSVGASSRGASVSVLPEEQLDARLDEVLAKIAREGRGGLTEEELRVLQEASRRARIRRSDRL
jgi:membrane associated rhomboid family serine protease